MRAAASSMASGTPSRRRQISRTAATILGSPRDAAAGGIRSVDEQAHGGEIRVQGLSRRRRRREVLRRRIRAPLAAAAPTRLVARIFRPGQWTRRSSSSAGDVRHLLEVVEHEDRGPVGEVLDERVPGGSRPLEDDTGLAGDAGDDVGPGGERLEGDERHRERQLFGDLLARPRSRGGSCRCPRGRSASRGAHRGARGGSRRPPRRPPCR